MKRCDWVDIKSPEYIKYHDEEWGVPVHKDKKLFEILILEGAQAGLSWLTILKKRDSYKKAFDDFDYDIISRYSRKKIEELMNNEKIVRNRLKINSVIKNAKSFIAIREEFGSFDNYIWRHVGGKTIINEFKVINEIPTQTNLSLEISKDLKKRGMNFVGPTIIYAFMQAVGIVDDHQLDCYKRKKK